MRSHNNAVTWAGVASVTMGASANSDPIWLPFIDGFSIQAVWTGTPAGTLKLQCSNDDGPVPPGTDPATVVVTNWTDIPASAIPAGGAAGNQVWNVATVYYRWVRLVFVQTGSTGSLGARFTEKGP